MDMIAEELGLDTLEMAIKNGLRAGDQSAAGFEIVSSGFGECLKKVSAMTGWKEKRERKSRDPNKAYGIGLGCGGFPSGAGFYFTNTTSAQSSAIIKASEGGGISVLTGASDIGQGSDSIINQIVAEVLGLQPEDIRVTSAPPRPRLSVRMRAGFAPKARSPRWRANHNCSASAPDMNGAARSATASTPFEATLRTPCGSAWIPPRGTSTRVGWAA